MKTQLEKPARSRATYSKEYQEEALALWRQSGRSAAKVAAELGIRAPLLYRWAKVRRNGAEHGTVPTEKPVPQVAELQAQIRRLSEENAKLLEQREVLKKSLGILCEQPPRGMPGSNA
ncbi:transposase IS3 [Opitutaceae bacterium TAV5]|nr:transposase IS3 [Opitutaceae bacterium TAV5]AHF93333.1 transposase IS3 [Opitutaceae bacterium TAV5]